MVNEAAQAMIKRLQKQLDAAKSENFQLKTIIENLPGSIYWKDKNGVYLGVNRSASDKMRSVNLIWNDIIGKTDYDLFPKEVADAYRQYDVNVMMSGKEAIQEEDIILPNGDSLVQLSSKRPLRDERGHIVGIIGNTVDITYLKKIEAELREAKEKAETANQLKTAFIRDMEHDIRTPFSGILNIATYLYERETDSTKKEYLAYITQSLNELLDYFNTILDFSRIESGVLPILAKKFDLHELLKGVIMLEQPAAEAKKLELLYEQSTDLPQVVISDPYRLKRILINLISNAIKFTPTGFVKLNARLIKSNNNRAIISFITEDSGIGIPLSQQDLIFERFTRVIPANQGLYKGYGLGLKVVKQFVDELEGEIEVISEIDKGSVFICTIPYKLPLMHEIADLTSFRLKRD